MNQKLKKVLGLALTLALLCGAMPAYVAADSSTSSEEAALREGTNSPEGSVAIKESESTAAKRFYYEHDPRLNPSAMADIEVDPSAVYGFKPSAAGSLASYTGFDWSDEELINGENGRLARIAYHESINEMYALMNAMSIEGKSVEEIARAISQKRNEIRLAEYEGNPEGLAAAKARNLERYGYEEGPRADDLYEQYGSWEVVLEKAFSANSGMDACLGLYDDYYGLYLMIGQIEDEHSAKALREYAVASFIDALGLELPDSTKALEIFSDSPSEYYAPELAKAVEMGILKGYEDGTLRPDESIDRVEAMVLLSRCLPELNASAEALSFTDVPNWAKSDIDRLSAAGLVQGYGDGTLGARDKLTVEQVGLLKERISNLAENKVVLGDEQFEEYLPLLEGKRVALFSNHTGIVGDKTSGIGELSEEQDASLIHFGQDAKGNEISYREHILDALIERDVNVVAIFSPEHGFRGTEDAGASIASSVDEKTGVPILSLYENDDTHAPSKENMDKFDVLLVDMQDVGLRYYTYYLSMYYLMDACASEGKEFIILDRPNPNGFYVDGPILKDAYKSNVGQLPIPVVYGMTWGELAKMINGEGWLSAGKDAAKLTVIPCQNYSHHTKTSLIRNPSPNIKDMRAVYLYASTCFFENTAVSVGRGTDFPFEAYGSPYLEGVEGYDFSFTPVSMSGATEPPFKDETCYGKDLREITIEEIWEKGINVDYLASAYSAVTAEKADVSFWGAADSQGRYWIDKLSGSDELRLSIEAGKSAEEIKAGWQDEIEAFKEQRRPYLIYAED